MVSVMDLLQLSAMLTGGVRASSAGGRSRQISWGHGRHVRPPLCSTTGPHRGGEGASQCRCVSLVDKGNGHLGVPSTCPAKAQTQMAAPAGMKPTSKTRKGTNALHFAAKKGECTSCCTCPCRLAQHPSSTGWPVRFCGHGCTHKGFPPAPRAPGHRAIAAEAEGKRGRQGQEGQHSAGPGNRPRCQGGPGGSALCCCAATGALCRNPGISPTWPTLVQC